MRILGIETSCDETGAAVIEGFSTDQPIKLLSNVIATSLEMHAATGGIIPEVAAREQVKYILPVIQKALSEGTVSHNGVPEIDAIAVTYGPGLIGSLLVGVETAKTLALLWKVPIIPVNHMHGHIYANFVGEIQNSKFKIQNANFEIPKLPALALVVSGGHTDLVLLKKHGDLEVIGGTRDDAAGEAFDKIGRLLGLSYPAGPVISRLAQKGDPKSFLMPRPMWDSKDFDFSFSGLKTHVLNLVKKNKWDFTKKPLGTEDEALLANLCASVQKTIVDVLLFKTLTAVKKYEVRTLLLSGGVAANKALTERFATEIEKQSLDIDYHVPPPFLCTDNGAMIAAAGFYTGNKTAWNDVTVDPELYY